MVCQKCKTEKVDKDNKNKLCQKCNFRFAKKVREYKELRHTLTLEAWLKGVK